MPVAVAVRVVVSVTISHAVAAAPGNSMADKAASRRATERPHQTAMRDRAADQPASDSAADGPDRPSALAVRVGRCCACADNEYRNGCNFSNSRHDEILRVPLSREKMRERN